MPRPDRRSVVLGGTAVLATAGLAALTGSSTARRSATATAPDIRSEVVFSRARGQPVNLVLMLPGRLPDRGLPMVAVLHARGGTARAATPNGMVRYLAQAVAVGDVPPFGLAAVDGGPYAYWHESTPGDDPMTMLLDELPVWLAARGLGGPSGRPFAAAGTSMGGFGALVYTRRRRERGDPLAATGVIAPALLTEWDEMSEREAFRDRRAWAALDPLRHPDSLGDTPLGVWCGTSDPFVAGTRRFVRRVHPEVAHFSDGGHTGNFYTSAVPGLVSFLGRYAPGQAEPRV
ncbi:MULTISPECIES: alpha/beta hydrolase [Prauserella salsuginis group]|uniref:Acyl-CoA:diacylglycerol acyltransferase n=1 Tax=Prauserella salsuginis TaxID=387889 RepID=A0ABW6G867_9PSEU|nr:MULTISPECIES: alpha/beta hydrolase-fold protein [Prauserella salsuginis group]